MKTATVLSLAFLLAILSLSVSSVAATLSGQRRGNGRNYRRQRRALENNGKPRRRLGKKTEEGPTPSPPSPTPPSGEGGEERAGGACSRDNSSQYNSLRDVLAMRHEIEECEYDGDCGGCCLQGLCVCDIDGLSEGNFGCVGGGNGFTPTPPTPTPPTPTPPTPTPPTPTPPTPTPPTPTPPTPTPPTPTPPTPTPPTDGGERAGGEGVCEKDNSDEFTRLANLLVDFYDSQTCEFNGECPGSCCLEGLCVCKVDGLNPGNIECVGDE